MSFRYHAVAALLCLSFSALDAQQPTLIKPAPKPDDATPTITAEAKLVNLPVVIRDKKGALVKDLTKADFTLQVDQKPQTIRYFDIDNNTPLTVGLLVDTSGSVASALDDERTASAAFLEKMLTPGRDKAFVIQFASQAELLEDVTGSLPKLQAAIKEIGPAPETSRPADPQDDNTAQGGRPRRPGTALYDAAFLAADDIMAKQTGRKALILLTDGDDRGSRETIAKAIEAAHRADTTIYAIYFKGQEPRQQYNNPNNGGQRRGGGYPGGGYPGGGGGYPGGGGGYPGGGGGYPNGGNGGGRGGNNPNPQPARGSVDGKKILERMTNETGGRTFEVKKQEFGAIYTEIADELHAQYRLGFTPNADQTSSGYHLVDLALPDKKFKNFVVQTRDGYYTGK